VAEGEEAGIRAAEGEEACIRAAVEVEHQVEAAVAQAAEAKEGRPEEAEQGELVDAGQVAEGRGPLARPTATITTRTTLRARSCRNWPNPRRRTSSFYWRWRKGPVGLPSSTQTICWAD
jgi:hypothetical protein